MARKKKEEVAEEMLGKGLFVKIKQGCHSITLVDRTIHCPNGIAYVTAEEKAQIEAMGLIAE